MIGLFKFGLVLAIVYAGYCYLNPPPPAGRVERIKAIEAEWKAAKKVESARQAVKAAEAKAEKDATQAEAEKREASRIPARTESPATRTTSSMVTSCTKARYWPSPGPLIRSARISSGTPT